MASKRHPHRSCDKLLPLTSIYRILLTGSKHPRHRTLPTAVLQQRASRRISTPSISSSALSTASMSSISSCWSLLRKRCELPPLSTAHVDIVWSRGLQVELRSVELLAKFQQRHESQLIAVHSCGVARSAAGIKPRCAVASSGGYTYLYEM